MEVTAVTTSYPTPTRHASVVKVEVTSLETVQLADTKQYHEKEFIPFYTSPSFPSFNNVFAYIRQPLTRVYIGQHFSSCQSTYQKWREYCI